MILPMFSEMYLPSIVGCGYVNEYRICEKQYSQ